MAKYYFPAVFTLEDNLYSIAFPDIKGCYSSSESLQEGLENAKDALCLMLYDMEESGEPIPAPSDIKSIRPAENQFVSLITCDTIDYRKYYDNKAVKKTLTIPAWLNTMSEREEINLAAVLQEALKERLGIDN